MADYNVIVIGGGPAGFSAAIYASRANLKTIVFEGLQPGGQLTTTTEVENFAGFPNGISGAELMNNMREQAKRFGTEDKFELVTAVDLSKQPYSITAGNNNYTTDTIIIATGAHAKYLGLASEEKLKGRGVSGCATCDGFFYKDKKVVVVGGGDVAMEEAIFLTNFASSVTILNRSEKFRASPIMFNRAKDNPKITVLTNKSVEEVLGNEKVIGVRIKDSVSGELQDLKTDGLFLAIGHSPNTNLFKGLLDMNETGYLITKPDSVATNIEGVYASGDVQDKVYRQAITSAGTGCMAALEAQKFIEHKRHLEGHED